VDAPSNQHALTALFPVLGGKEDALARALEEDAGSLAAKLEQASTLHFARVLVLPAGTNAGHASPAQLVLATTYDGALGEHLAELWDALGPELGRWLSFCEGWRSPGGAAELERCVRSRLAPVAAQYRAHPGLSVGRILADARLRAAVGDLLDARRKELVALSDEEIVDWVRASLSASEAGADLWYEPAAEPRNEQSALGILATHGLALAWAFARSFFHEVTGAVHALWHDVAPGPARAPVRGGRLAPVRGLERALSQVTSVKPGRFRRAALRLALRVTHELAQTATAVSAARSIHGARWVLLADGRLVLFCDYSGSLAACVGALVDRAGGWLSLLFSQTERFPFTLGWLFGGARDEARFRAWLTAGEVPTPVVYSAYPTLSAAEIAVNGELRGLLTGPLDAAAARRVLALIKD
jgi:hypothetical protein